MKHHFRKHEREQVDAGKSFECYLCKFQFLRIQGLRVHINVKHVSSLKNNNLQCEQCNGMVFTQQTALDDHLRTEHQLAIPFKCPHCNMKFQQDKSAALKEHLATHSELKPFMCEVRVLIKDSNEMFSIDFTLCFSRFAEMHFVLASNYTFIWLDIQMSDASSVPNAVKC